MLSKLNDIPFSRLYRQITPPCLPPAIVRSCGAAPRRIDGHDCADVKVPLVHLSLDQVSDAAKRERLQAIPTSLTIPNDHADALVR